MTYCGSGVFCPPPQSNKKNFSRGSVIVEDKEGKDSSGMVGRNLYFRQNVYVQSLVLELYTNNVILNKSPRISNCNFLLYR